MASEKKMCKRCGKQYPVDKKFYKTKTATEEFPDGIYPICKGCLENTYKASEPATFMPILKSLDLPWIPSEYRSIYNKNVKPSSPNNIAILGKYIMKMKLIQYSKYGFLDSDAAQKKFESSENYDSIGNYNYNVSLEKPIVLSSPVNSNFSLEAVTSENMSGGEILERQDSYGENIDVSDELTQEDLKYLVLKWGNVYSISQMMTLEKLYMEMCEDFDIRTTTQKDYLRKYCQASLRYDECLASQDFESAKKASSMFTNINKEAGFTPAGNASGVQDYLSSVSYLVKLAEAPGPIPRWDVNESPDMVDISIKDIKLWQKHLVEDDDTIMERFAIAKEELEKQDKLLKEKDFGDEDVDGEGISSGLMNGVDVSVYDVLDREGTFEIDFSDGEDF